MGLANYSDLKSSIASWLKRADLTDSIPDLITLCEARIARDLRIRSQVVYTELSVNKGIQDVSLPDDWLEVENLGINSTPDVNLKYMSVESLNTNYPPNGTNGIPNYYCIEGSSILLGPVPDTDYTLQLLYYKRYNIAVTNTNWLLTNHPNIYLFGALAEAAAFIMNDERITLWEAKYKDGVDALQTSDNNAQFSGSSLRVRNI